MNFCVDMEHLDKNRLIYKYKEMKKKQKKVRRCEQGGNAMVYHVDFSVTGSLCVEADSEKDAKAKVERIDSCELAEHIDNVKIDDVYDI